MVDEILRAQLRLDRLIQVAGRWPTQRREPRQSRTALCQAPSVCLAVRAARSVRPLAVVARKAGHFD